jgi:hypothetical protein
MKPRLRIATCMELPEVDADAEPLAAALAAAGIAAELLAWDDPAVDWDAPIPTLLRSTWNYALHVDAFRAWIDRIAVLWNPHDVVRGNISKRYLLELMRRNVPTVHTAIVERGASLAALEERSVIKPEIGAGSLDARVFEAGDIAGANAHLQTIFHRCAALVQPYVTSVDDYGERSLIWIAGDFTHAIKKTPRFSGDAERVTGPHPIADDERAVGEAALAPYVDRILYGRVDLARDSNDRPCVMELELIEPSLFFPKHPPALDRLIAALAARL